MDSFNIRESELVSQEEDSASPAGLLRSMMILTTMTSNVLSKCLAAFTNRVNKKVEAAQKKQAYIGPERNPFEIAR
jgi:hypothetical protein